MFFADKTFLRPLLPMADAILGYFADRMDHEYNLVVSKTTEPGVWHFHDWTNEWRPYGIPPAVVRTGISTYSNSLYSYTLQLASHLQKFCYGRAEVATEYLERSRRVADAIRKHCFDGEFFTDSLASGSDPRVDRSQHSQVWAVLCGATENKALSRDLLRRSLTTTQSSTAAASADSLPPLIQTSVAMSFYSLRALSKVGGILYEEVFHGFWKPWHAQLALGLSTWEEDTVSHRSDCHAWGSAPIYEFMAEVVGFRPAQPGWTDITFAPRISLYSELTATVPFRTGPDRKLCLASVSWKPTASGGTRVSLSISGLQRGSPVRVVIPSLPVRIVEDPERIGFTISDKAVRPAS
ncbi:Six-hairpin glycosidase-like protein [Aspergillus pseudoustus]|uniref:Six-hairpin glycosidase-like protein n=1 Tax=Aspergillus pseudoustus TaxID=1810923 RepID=A0ABR4J987_9EURO